MSFNNQFFFIFTAIMVATQYAILAAISGPIRYNIFPYVLLFTFAIAMVIIGAIWYNNDEVMFNAALANIGLFFLLPLCSAAYYGYAHAKEKYLAGRARARVA